MQDLDPQLGDFGDLAVIIDQLDLVITVDSSVAHIAGALGKKAWTLLSHVADWRWMLEGETTPWYPTMRLFRQTRPGDWSGVIERVAETLRRPIKLAKGEDSQSKAPSSQSKIFFFALDREMNQSLRTRRLCGEIA